MPKQAVYKILFLLSLISVCACSWSHNYDEIYAFDAVVYGNKKSISVNEFIINETCEAPDCKNAQKNKEYIIKRLKHTQLLDVINKKNYSTDYSLYINQEYTSEYTNKLALYTLGILPSERKTNIKYIVEILNNKTKQKKEFIYHEDGSEYICILSIFWSMIDEIILDGNTFHHRDIAESRIMQQITKDSLSFIYPLAKGDR